MDPEPITASTPRPLRHTLLTQWWRELTFLHWRTDPTLLEPFMPPGARPDVFDGSSWIGLIAFRMVDLGFGPLHGVPYFGSFLETNVRLYSMDSLGRRGVVFLSLDADRLAPVLVSRQWPRIPYTWSKMSMQRNGTPATGTEPLRAGERLTYTARRRWPAPRGARSRISVEVGEKIPSPSERDAFLTARWGLHTTTVTGRARYLPNAHPAWALREATVLECDDELIAATGLAQPTGAPESVLVTDGVPVRFGGPLAAPPC